MKSILEKNNDLSEAQRLDLVNAVSLDGDFLAALKEIQTRWRKFKDFFKGNDEKALGKHWKVPELDDAEFLRSLSEVEMAEPIFGNSVETLRKLAQWGLRQILEDSAKRVTESMIFAQETELKNTAKALSKEHIKRAEHEATATLRKAIVANLFGKGELCVSFPSVRKWVGLNRLPQACPDHLRCQAEVWCDIFEVLSQLTAHVHSLKHVRTRLASLF